MSTAITDNEKQILVDLVRMAVQKLRAYPSGVRLFCGDKEVLSYLLDQAKIWGSFVPIYLPSDLWSVVDEFKHKHQNRVFNLDGDPATLLESLWPVLAYHWRARAKQEEQEVRGCFRVPSTYHIEDPPKKLSVLIGDPASNITDTSFNELTSALGKQKEQAVDFTISFRSTMSAPGGLFQKLSGAVKGATGTVNRREREKRKLVLRYVEDAFLKHCLPDSRGDFAQAFPPNNLSDSEAHYESDFGQLRGPRLGQAIEQVAMQSQVTVLKERLHNNPVIIVGGFGSGSDFLSWLALRDIARNAHNGGLFRIMQFAGTVHTAKALSDLLSDDFHVRGTGLILRDLLDPITAHCPAYLDEYKVIKGFLHEPGATVLHNYKLKYFLDAVRQDPRYRDTRVIITSQYDSLEQLRFAVGNREYGNKWRLNKERRENALAILNDPRVEFWNPARDMENSVMEDATLREFRAWLNRGTNTVPRWLGRIYQSEQNHESKQDIKRGQIQQLIQRSNIAGMYRIGAWCRMWVKLLDSCAKSEDFVFVMQEAERYASSVLEAHVKLHDLGLFGSSLHAT